MAEHKHLWGLLSDLKYLSRLPVTAGALTYYLLSKINFPHSIICSQLRRSLFSIVLLFIFSN
jgi:hypothetical protein